LSGNNLSAKKKTDFELFKCDLNAHLSAHDFLFIRFESMDNWN